MSRGLRAFPPEPRMECRHCRLIYYPRGSIPGVKQVLDAARLDYALAVLQDVAAHLHAEQGEGPLPN